MTAKVLDLDRYRDRKNLEVMAHTLLFLSYDEIKKIDSEDLEWMVKRLFDKRLTKKGEL